MFRKYGFIFKFTNRFKQYVKVRSKFLKFLKFTENQPHF
ncbi:unknown [[Mannheimia] succiniciproducens MBEL55E]|uniref:Uncharacterized protein n=1 Tax=Mannheimia succiniciproducens (strain KCTC 0769BP / MBEL55E) TaxID=221988 RepID=Q65TI8_MANSM|nr:unknown [[Mannheimia] succiniciproducens MBEL55E]